MNVDTGSSCSKHFSMRVRMSPNKTWWLGFAQLFFHVNNKFLMPSIVYTAPFRMLCYFSFANIEVEL